MSARKKSKKQGRLLISYDLLKDWLRLSDDVNIVRVFHHYDHPKRFDVVVESDCLDEVIEGAEIPIISIEQAEGYDE